MSRYGKYFLQHSLWLEDDFCNYYVQDDAWGRHDILDVGYTIFDFREDAEDWLIRCANWDPRATVWRLRGFLAKDCLSHYQVHRMNDRQVMRTAARELSLNMCRIVIEPKIGWAVRVDQATKAPVQPIDVEAGAVIGDLLAELKVHLDAMVADRQRKTDELDAKLAEMNILEKGIEYNKRAIKYNPQVMILRQNIDTVRSLPDTLKSVGKLMATQANILSSFAESIRMGSIEPIDRELEKAISPMVETALEVKEVSAMMQVLLSDDDTSAVLHDFARRYINAMHRLDVMEYGMKVGGMLIMFIASIVAAINTGGASAAGTAGRTLFGAQRLAGASSVVNRLFMAIKNSPTVAKLHMAIKKANTLKSKVLGKNKRKDTPKDKTTQDLDNKNKKVYPDTKHGDNGGLKTTTGPSRLNTYGDALRGSLGPARKSHPDELDSILKHADDSNVKVTFREGTLAYEPSLSPGKPGRLILDRDASIGAVRHEFRHMLDDIDAGHPGFRVLEDSQGFWRSEYRGYMEEIGVARQTRDYKAGKAILKEMRARRIEILGR